MPAPDANSKPAAAFRDTGTVFIVTGETGEYSDRQEWQVAVFDHKEDAERFRSQCERLAKDANPRDVVSGAPTDHPLDPDFDSDYTGTHYWVCEVRKVEPV
jgi:hypothetical protein